MPKLYLQNILEKSSVAETSIINSQSATWWTLFENDQGKQKVAKRYFVQHTDNICMPVLQVVLVMEFWDTRLSRSQCLEKLVQASPVHSISVIMYSQLYYNCDVDTDIGEVT